MKNRKLRRSFYEWLGEFLKNHYHLFVYTIVAITMLLLIPVFLMQPTETASDDPTNNDTVIWYKEIQENFPSEAYSMVFIVESEEGDMLIQGNLYALYQKEEELRNSEMRPFLYESSNSTTGIISLGIYTLADAVNTTLVMSSSNVIDLSNATDLQVKQAVYSILSNTSTGSFARTLSIQAGYEETTDGIKLWSSPALTVVVYSIGDSVISKYPALTGGNYAGDIVLEYFGREILALLQEKSPFQVWGINIDLNLEISDEGSINTPMLIVAILIILVIVAIIFRSLIITMISGLGLIMVMVWLNGFSNLIGIKNSTVVDLIVPIIVLVLGIDYAIHSVFRYLEERRKGYPPQQALGNSVRNLGSALMLAMLTTFIAFMSNIISNIESIVHFAIASSFAIFATYIILGLFVPVIVMWYDLRKAKNNPASIMKIRKSTQASFMGNIAAFFNKKWFISLPLILIVTLAGILGWSNLETRLEAKDALDPESAFVIGLDKVTEH
ncbi:MAG: MMPL family transporter, partial [Dehalococcoidales bacterium]|nr:MMPL family transporter [Dehalococcoidales bacterium]